jgi:hypothetical protein
MSSNMYSFHAHYFVKNILLSFLDVSVHFSYIDISQKTWFWEICTFLEVMDIKNGEVFYGENVKRGDVLWCMPVLK